MRTIVIAIVVLCAASVLAGPGIDREHSYVERLDTVRFERVCHSVRTGCPDGNPGCCVLHWKEVCAWQPVVDTVWGQKVQVWLTPDQLKRLLEWLTPVPEPWISDGALDSASLNDLIRKMCTDTLISGAR